MEKKRDYYEVLGIDKSADDGAIKKAYRKLAKKYHPDTNSGNPEAEKKFKEITEAYSILSDPEKKKLYDQFGHAAFESGGGQTGEESGWNQGGFDGKYGTYREYHFEDRDMDDIFGDIFGNIFRNGGDGQFRRSGFRRSHFYDDEFAGDYSQRGQDLNAEVFIDFDEAAFGCDKVITLKNPNMPEEKTQTLQVHIPAGIDDGQCVRLRGKGMAGLGKGPAGDLLLKVKVGQRQGFERRGVDVYTTVYIPFTTAVFGGEVRVQTLNGAVLCKIQEGTQSGTKIRLKGKGIVSMKNPSVYGDLYAVVRIDVPRSLDAQAKQKLKEYEQACRQGRAAGGKHAA